MLSPCFTKRHTMETSGGMEVQSQSKRLVAGYSRLTSGKRTPGAHWIGDSVGPRRCADLQTTSVNLFGECSTH